MEKRYPFKFLDAYTREDKDFYFGREDEISQMYDMVFQTNLLLVYGGSGVGKSSLIQCGLSSRFDSHDWQSIFIRRGNDINESLDTALVEAGGDIDEKDDLDWLDQDWSSEKSTEVQSEKSLLSRRLNTIHLKNFKPIYLIFDQFEELFIFGNNDEKSTFYHNIKEIISSEQQVKVIFLIREEYLGHLYEFEQVVPQLLRKKIRIEPMNLEKVTDVVTGISKAQNILVTIKKGEEKQFAKQVFDRIKGGENRITIELPYLQVFFDKLYVSITHDEARTTPAEFSLASLENIGDIGDILKNMLDEQVAAVVGKLDVPEDAVWKFLSFFVSLEGTKDPKSLDEIIDNFSNIRGYPVRRLLNEFVSRRILRKSQRDFTYEISHDTLAKQISMKRSDDEIALLEMKRMIHGMASLKEESREYFSEKQIVLITPMLDKLHLNEEEQKWVDKSMEHVQMLHEEAEAKRNAELKKTKRWLRGTAALLCLALVALVFAGFQTHKASRAKTKSEILLADNQRSFGLFLFARPDSTRMGQAKEVFAEIARKNVARPEDYGYLGTCYLFSGDKDKALEQYQKCLSASRKKKRYENRYDLNLSTQMLTPEQAKAEANRLLAHFYFEEKDFQKAYEYSVIATETLPEDYDAWMDLSHYAIFTRRYDQSIAAAKKALSIENDRKEVVRFLALAYALNGDKKSSKNIYDKYFNTIFKGPASSYSKNPLLKCDTTWRFSTPMFFDDLEDVKNAMKNATNIDFVQTLLDQKLEKFINEIEMVEVSGGTFAMGNSGDSNASLHQVTLSDYAIGKYEVTQKLWKTVMGYNTSFCQGDSMPVQNITWYEANTFTQRLSMITKKHFRLPTEAEWEYAAMGGNMSHHYTYSGFNDIMGNANFKSKTVADIGHPVEVYNYKPNELGIFNMCGNVWEWCSDWYGVYSDTFEATEESQKWNPSIPIVNPKGKVNFTKYDDKILRGGSFDSEQGRCTVKNRHHHHPSMKGDFYGFRLARD